MLKYFNDWLLNIAHCTKLKSLTDDYTKLYFHITFLHSNHSIKFIYKNDLTCIVTRWKIFFSLKKLLHFRRFPRFCTPILLQHFLPGRFPLFHSKKIIVKMSKNLISPQILFWNQVWFHTASSSESIMGLLILPPRADFVLALATLWCSTFELGIYIFHIFLLHFQWFL